MRDAFPILFTIGVLAGLAWLLLGDPMRRWSGRWRDLDAAAFLRVDAGLAALTGGLLGARLAYVVAHAGYFASHLAQALSFSSGGLSWVGGALGATLGLALFVRWRQAPILPLADTLAFPAALLAAASWGGCLLDGCAYGRPLPSGSPTLFSSDFFRSSIARWPTQMVGLLACCALALGLLALETRTVRPGLLTCLTTASLGLLGMALSFSRGDPVPLVANMRLDFVGAALVAAVGIAGWIMLRRRRPA
jgi:phosphatidylglycerol---prolipoprotein diacylglyceryl transferase